MIPIWNIQGAGKEKEIFSYLKNSAIENTVTETMQDPAGPSWGQTTLQSVLFVEKLQPPRSSWSPKNQI